jgi:hypothetical protein
MRSSTGTSIHLRPINPVIDYPPCRELFNIFNEIVSTNVEDVFAGSEFTERPRSGRFLKLLSCISESYQKPIGPAGTPFGSELGQPSSLENCSSSGGVYYAGRVSAHIRPEEDPEFRGFIWTIVAYRDGNGIV